MDLPPPDDLSTRVSMIEYQCHTILVLSAINMIANLLTIGVALFAVW